MSPQVQYHIVSVGKPSVLNYLAMRSDAGAENGHDKTWINDVPTYEPLREAPQFETKDFHSHSSLPSEHTQACRRAHTHMYTYPTSYLGTQQTLLRS